MSIDLYRLAQEITDEVLGPGTYERMNKFDPSRRQRYQGDKVNLRQGTRVVKPPIKAKKKKKGKGHGGHKKAST